MIKQLYLPFIVIILILLALSIFLTSPASTKLEICAGALSILFLAMVVYEKTFTVTIPENAIKVTLSIEGLHSNVGMSSSSKILKNTVPDITVDTSSIPKWEHTNIGEVSLAGENLNQKKIKYE